MLRLSTFRSKRVPLNFKPYTPPTTPNLDQINSIDFSKKSLPLNPIDLTNEKIEKRSTWPRTYPVKIFNPDGSSYVIHHHEPKSFIQVPKDISGMTDKMDYIRRVKMAREGTKTQSFVELERDEGLLEEKSW